MTRDQELYREIGKRLYEAAPDNASKIIMKARLVAEGDACAFEYDFIDNSGHQAWFLPSDGRTDQTLRELLVALRDFFVLQNQPAWNACEFILNVPDGRFSVRFLYE